MTGMPIEDPEGSTRQRVLTLVVENGPVTAGEIAAELQLTAAAVRRHTAYLLDLGLITDHGPTGAVAPRRGRPARYFVATDAAHADLRDTSAELATQTLAFLREVAGEEAIERFAEWRATELERRYGAVLARAGDSPAERVEALAEALSDEGYAATVRQVGDGFALQLCQGHCPVQPVAEEFPHLCEAETQAFARLLGIHVQRLATLAGGGHVCTTHVPLAVPTTPTTPVHQSSTSTTITTAREGHR